MKARKYKAAYMLLDGLNAWKEDVLFPAPPDGTSPEQVAALGERARHFGGTPQSGGAAAAERAPVVMPKIELPAGAIPPRTTKKRREGC